MRRFLIATAIVSATLITPVLAADVGVSVSVGQPGFYGRIDIGGYPQPRLIYRQPMVIERVPMNRPPIYLHVPPGHAKNWRKHCRKYNACGERAYFVQDSWYNREYVPRYQEQHRGRQDGRHDKYRGDQRGDHGSDRRGNDHDRGRNH